MADNKKIVIEAEGIYGKIRWELPESYSKGIKEFGPDTQNEVEGWLREQVNNFLLATYCSFGQGGDILDDLERDVKKMLERAAIANGIVGPTQNQPGSNAKH